MTDNSVKVNKVKEKGEVVKKIKVDKTDNNIIDIVLCDDLNILEDKNNETINYKFKYEINNIKLPLKKNSVVGKIKVYNNKFIKSSNLCINRDVNKLNLFDLYIRNIISVFSCNL